MTDTGRRARPRTGEAKMIAACNPKTAKASHRQAASPQFAPTKPPIAAPMGRAPTLTVTTIALTRPISAAGVTVWRKVVEVMVHKIGPAPKVK